MFRQFSFPFFFETDKPIDMLSIGLSVSNLLIYFFSRLGKTNDCYPWTEEEINKNGWLYFFFFLSLMLYLLYLLNLLLIYCLLLSFLLFNFLNLLLIYCCCCLTMFFFLFLWCICGSSNCCYCENFEV